MLSVIEYGFCSVIRYNLSFLRLFETKKLREERAFLLLSIFYCASFLDRIVGFVDILKQKTTRVESMFNYNVASFLDIMFQLFDFLKQKRMESERGSFIIVIFNVRLFLDIIFHFFDFLKQKTTRVESKFILMNIESFLKCEVASPLNVRFVRYFISIDTEREIC